MADRETQIVNFYESTLASLLASGATSTTVTNAPTTDGTSVINASAGNYYYLVIDPDNSNNREVVLVTASSGTTLSTITRDVEGRHTSDPDHQAGTTVRLAVLAEHMEDLNDRIDADETTNATHRTDGTKHFLLVDEDDMASNSATVAASQQSIKAYVDAQTSGGVSLGLVLALS